jgi:hypothetical protein
VVGNSFARDCSEYGRARILTPGILGAGPGGSPRASVAVGSGGGLKSVSITQHTPTVSYNKTRSLRESINFVTHDLDGGFKPPWNGLDHGKELLAVVRPAAGADCCIQPIGLVLGFGQGPRE